VRSRGTLLAGAAFPASKFCVFDMPPLYHGGVRKTGVFGSKKKLIFLFLLA
jgi:hypothetical protein